MSFRVGQKVVCITKSWVLVPSGESTNGPEYGAILKITAFFEGYLVFKEFPEIIDGEPDSYAPKDFRPLDETFAENILAEITEKVKEEQLINI